MRANHNETKHHQHLINLTLIKLPVLGEAFQIRVSLHDSSLEHNKTTKNTKALQNVNLGR